MHKSPSINLFTLVVLLAALSAALGSAASSRAEAQSGFSCGDVSEIPESECEALYNATDGDSWIGNNQWGVTNTPAPPTAHGDPTLRELPPARGGVERPPVSPSPGAAQEIPVEAGIISPSARKRANALRDAGVQFDLPERRMPRGSSVSALSTSEEICVQVLRNPGLDVVEFGDGTSSVEYWSILYQKVHYDTQYYDSPYYALFMVDELDGSDPISDPWGFGMDYDAFGQSFWTPPNMTRIIAWFSSDYLHWNVSDFAWSNLCTLTAEGYLDEFVFEVEIPQSSTDSFERWYWEVTAADYPEFMAAMSNRPLAILYDHLSDGQAPGQVIWLDDLQVTVCYRDDTAFSISGRVRDASSAGIEGVTVSAGAGRSATTDTEGAYTLTGLVTGTYTLTPSKSDWTFSPETRTVSVPPDATGQDFTGEPGSQLELIGIEVTQGIQNWENEVVLIENRPTVVRGHIRSIAGTVRGVTAELIGRRKGAELPLSPLSPSNAGETIDVLENPSRSQLNDSFYFELPRSWRSGAVEFELRGVSNPMACKESEGVGDDCTAEVEFLPSPELEVEIVSVVWRSLLGWPTYRPSHEQVQNVEREVLATFPVPRVDITRSEWVLPWNGRPKYDPDGFDDFDRILNQLSLSRRMDGCITGPPTSCGRYYLGILANPPFSGLMGVAPTAPADVAVAYVTDGLTRAHELGHCAGRWHTDYNAQRELRNPEAANTIRHHEPTDGTISEYKSGALAVHGFDMRTWRIYGPDTPDLMSYGRPNWPSPWTYTHIRDHLVARYGDSATSLAVLAQEPAVVVSGAVTPTPGTGTLESIFAFDAPVSASAPDPGTYAIRFEDSQGDELAAYSFELNYPLAYCVGCADYGEGNVGTFALFLPWNANAARMVLLHNEQELDSRTASANPPTVTVVHPNGGEFLTGSSATLSWSASDPDGDPLEYAVQYSTDAGASWQTLASAWVSTTYELNLEAVAGTDEGLLRVLASDGFHTSEARSEGTFAVARRPPNVSISSPPDDSLFVGDQTIILEGGAYDNEDGQLGDSALSWSSDLDGALGTGRSLAIVSSHLSEGTHTITLSGQDSDGQSDAASITVQIYRERPELPPTLAVAPDGITFVSAEGSGQTLSKSISIRNDGDGTMTWSAAADHDWILIGALEGTAPSDVGVVADVSRLSIGEHTGTITVTASGAVNSPQTVGVTLFVMPPRDIIYLPLVLRSH